MEVLRRVLRDLFCLFRRTSVLEAVGLSRLSGVGVTHFGSGTLKINDVWNGNYILLHNLHFRRHLFFKFQCQYTPTPLNRENHIS